MTGRIVVGIDGSEGSRRALAWALDEARVRRAAVQAATVWQSPYDREEVETLVSGLKLLGDWARDRDRRLAEAAGWWWRGDAVPAFLPEWPEDSLSDRLFSDRLFRSALGVPPLESAQVPDSATIRSDPAQWSVAAWVLVRAVVLDGLGVEDPAVAVHSRGAGTGYAGRAGGE